MEPALEDVIGISIREIISRMDDEGRAADVELFARAIATLVSTKIMLEQNIPAGQVSDGPDF